MKHTLTTFPDYMADGELYRVGESIDWVKFGLQCKEWKEGLEAELRQKQTAFHRKFGHCSSYWVNVDELLGEIK